MAEPTYVEESDSGNLGASLSSLSHTIPSGWSVGDLCLAIVTCDGARNIGTPPTGWVQIGTQQSGSLRSNVYRKVLESGDINASHTWPIAVNTSFGSNQIVFIRIQGHDPTTPVNIYAEGADGSSGFSHVSPEVTTTVADCLILRIIGSQYPLTASTGDTGAEELQNYRIRIFRSSKASAGATGTATYTTANSYNCTHHVIAIAPTGGGGSTPVPVFHHHLQTQGIL